MPPPSLPSGKLPGRLLEQLLEHASGHDAAVRIGPAVGEDAAVIDVPAGALVVASDPITLTAGEAGRYAVLINANDVAVTGVAPRWFLATVLLPTGTSEAAVRELFSLLTDALDEVGATLVGGHTEVTAAVRAPVVVGQMLGLAADGEVVATGGAEPGHQLVQIGPAPVEGAAVLAAEHAARLGGLDDEVLRAATAAAHDPGIGIVAPALRAARLGATAMHDPTEGGLAAGLHELAHASNVALDLDGSALLWFEPGVEVCRRLGCDPWATLASGCVLATFAASQAQPAVEDLIAEGHQAAVIGRVSTGRGVRVDGRSLVWPDRDEVSRLGD